MFWVKEQSVALLSGHMESRLQCFQFFQSFQLWCSHNFFIFDHERSSKAACRSALCIFQMSCVAIACWFEVDHILRLEWQRAELFSCSWKHVSIMSVWMNDRVCFAMEVKQWFWEYLARGRKLSQEQSRVRRHRFANSWICGKVMTCTAHLGRSTKKCASIARS